jgi:aerobic C4-dicarboxylate transport protein
MRPAAKPAQRFYEVLWIQVLIGIALAILLGWLRPGWGTAMKPLGDAFIRLITMIITLIIFFTVVSGIAGLQDVRRVGRIGGKALVYFEVISTIALFLGLLIGNVAQPGRGVNADAASLDASLVQPYAGQARQQSATEFLINVIPSTVVSAFVKGDLLQVLVIAVLFGLALASDPRCRPVVEVFDAGARVVFAIVNFVMRLAPIGAFGAIAFTVGRYGVASLGPLLKLIVLIYVTAAFFILVVLGAVARLSGFSIVRFLLYIREEMLVVLSTCSSDAAMPSLMEKLELLGCSKPLVGLVVPAGYVFNTDGSALYMTLAALFVAQATHTPLTWTQQLTVVGVALLTSKGASGVQGAAFVALVATLTVIPTIPVAGMALLVGVDRFMAGCRGMVNMVGNGVATVVLALWEREIGKESLRQSLTVPVATDVLPA